MVIIHSHFHRLVWEWYFIEYQNQQTSCSPNMIQYILPSSPYDFPLILGQESQITLRRTSERKRQTLDPYPMSPQLRLVPKLQSSQIQTDSNTPSVCWIRVLLATKDSPQITIIGSTSHKNTTGGSTFIPWKKNILNFLWKSRIGKWSFVRICSFFGGSIYTFNKDDI